MIDKEASHARETSQCQKEAAQAQEQAQEQTQSQSQTQPAGPDAMDEDQDDEL